jgi:hypothetical protein
MKRFYSIIASTSREVSLTDPDVLLEPGPNVFTVLTVDIDDVVERLKNLGVTVRAVHCLSESDPDTGDLNGK